MAQNNSLSILEVVTKSSLFLKRKGVPNHKIDAEWLMAHALGCQRMELYLRFGEILTETLLEKIRALVVKRGERVPLQHILGYVPFAGLKLKCDKRALVPRYETEYLVDCINQKLSTKFCGKIADFGWTVFLWIVSMTLLFQTRLTFLRMNGSALNLKFNFTIQRLLWLQTIMGFLTSKESFRLRKIL